MHVNWHKSAFLFLPLSQLEKIHQEKVVSPFTLNPWGLDINWIFIGLMLRSPRRTEATLVVEEWINPMKIPQRGGYRFDKM